MHIAFYSSQNKKCFFQFVRFLFKLALRTSS
nr:MAG TPA: hypothetical protein [Caudoviricetes sp.]